jgi:hypothetical protein
MTVTFVCTSAILPMRRQAARLDVRATNKEGEFQNLDACRLKSAVSSLPGFIRAGGWIGLGGERTRPQKPG